MTKEQKLSFIIEVVFLFLLVAVIIVLFKWVLPWTLPFVLGFGVAILINNIASIITKRLKFKQKYAVLFATLFVYVPLVLFLWVLSAMLFTQLAAFVSTLPLIYNRDILPSVEMLFRLPIFDEHPDLWVTVQRVASDIASSVSAKAVSMVSSIASSIPNLSITIIFTIISSVLISLDYNSISAFLYRQLPESVKSAVMSSKDYMFSSLFKMLKAYSLILFITFLELAVGLWALRVEYFLAIAAITALLDILPVIGTGFVLNTWAVIEAIKGNYTLAIALVVLWGIITLMRNLIEPRIVSQQIGLHPLVTITAMFFGLQVAGVLGLISAPLAALLIKYLHENGHLTFLK